MAGDQVLDHVPMKPQKPSAKHQELLLKALALHQSGQLPEAAALYNQLLNLFPKQPQLLTGLGTIALQQGKLKEGIKLLGKSLAIAPQQPEVWFNQAIALANTGLLEEAIAAYDKAIVMQPDYAQAYSNRGNLLQNLKCFQEAVASYAAAITCKPDYAEAYNNQGAAYKELQQYPAALHCFEAAIRLKPEYIEPYNNLGLVLHDLQRYAEAIAAYDQALTLKPDYAEAYFNRGNTWQQLQKFNAALADFDRAIALTPDYPQAYNNRGNTLRELQQVDAALACFEQAIRLKPDHAEAHNNRGMVLKELNRFEEALLSYDCAIAAKPDFAEAHNNRGIVLYELKRFPEAIISYDKALKLKPDFEFLYGQRLQTKLQICDWRDIEQEIAELLVKIEHQQKASNPFTVMAVTDQAAVQRKAAEIGIAEKFPRNNALGPIAKYPLHPKIRLAYVSADFRNHPVSFLTAELYEKHDRDRFEVIGFSCGVEVNDEMRTRLKQGFDQFIDIRNLTDIQAVQLFRRMEIDIAIDLGGHTGESRTGIFALRAAPLQASYLGYVGSIGAEYIDYLIADPVVIPAAAKHHYLEKIVYLPSYQANDTQRRIADTEFSREQLGLPATGFVFCCFNNTYKIQPDQFACWMSILDSVADSVLLLYAENSYAEQNLKNAAAAYGINPARLVFGKQLPLPLYLARYRQADLFLDTLPYNAGTTASDALWAGLPVLTCSGEAFAGRMAASLLTAIGLPELITETRQQYQALAIDLASHPQKLADIKTKLAQNRLTTPLFDIQGFAQHIEKAYTQMYQRYQADLPAADISLV